MSELTEIWNEFEKITDTDKARQIMAKVSKRTDAKVVNIPRDEKGLGDIIRIPSDDHSPVSFFFMMPELRKRYVPGYHSTNYLLSQRIIKEGLFYRPGRGSAFFTPAGDRQGRTRCYANRITDELVSYSVKNIIQNLLDDEASRRALLGIDVFGKPARSQTYNSVFVRRACEYAKEFAQDMAFDTDEYSCTREVIPIDLSFEEEFQGALLEALIPVESITHNQNGHFDHEKGKFTGYEISIKELLPESIVNITPLQDIYAKDSIICCPLGELLRQLLGTDEGINRQRKRLGDNVYEELVKYPRLEIR